VAAVLDEFLPAAAHRTRYVTSVRTDADAAWAAMRAITSRELAVTRILMAVRTMSLSALRPDDDEAERPVLETFLQRGFTVLREDEPRTLVLATTGQPWRMRGAHLEAPADAAAFAAYDEPGAVRVAMSFELDAPAPDASRLATETRIAPTDADAARTFGRYWTVVRPGSDIIRMDVLRAVRRRAERA
jgi:hypothetical protein